MLPASWHLSCNEIADAIVRRAADGTRWNWKTAQRLNVDGRWKIASEFYTGHGLK